MIKQLRLGAFIQCNASNLYPSKNENNYCIGVVKRSKVFDQVILTVPDERENDIFDNLAKKWQVKLVKGSIYNVSERFLKAAKLYNIDLIARILLKRFYLDIATVSSMFDLLVKEKADYIKLPNDYNYELAADVFTTKALKKATKLSQGNDPETAYYQFSPWQLMDEDKLNFKTILHPGSNFYPKSKVKKIKAKLSKFYGENQEKYGWDFPASHYAFAMKYIGKNKKILDIACGQGEGVRQLAQTQNEILGVDLNDEYLNNAKEHFSDLNNIKFHLADAQKFSRPNQFDVITSMHTLEHLPNPLKFLKLCHLNLKPGGVLMIEVPVLLPKPLGEPLYPFHIKEFTIQELEKLLNKAKFKTIKKFGRSRGVYTTIDKTREAVQFHCIPFK